MGMITESEPDKDIVCEATLVGGASLALVKGGDLIISFIDEVDEKTNKVSITSFEIPSGKSLEFMKAMVSAMTHFIRDHAEEYPKNSSLTPVSNTRH